MDLDDIRLKDVSELSAEEKGLLSTNWDKLTEEEKDYFGTIKTSSSSSDMPFKTKEELDKYLDQMVEKRISAMKEAEEDEARKKASPSDEKLFPDGYKAKDWNEAFATAMPKIEDKIMTKLQKLNQEQRDRLAKIDEKYNQEFQQIAAKDRAVPPAGTKERDDWEAEIANIGVKYKLTSMTDAYEVYKALNTGKQVDEGTQPANLRQEGTPAVKQASLAAKVGRGYGTGSQPSKTRYVAGAGQRLDDLLQRRMREEGIE